MIEKNQIHAITENDLINAFSKWNEGYIDNPDGFGELDASVDCAENQARQLLKLIKDNASR